MATLVELILTALQFQTEGLLEIGDLLFAMPARIQKGTNRIPTDKRQWFSKNWADLYRDRQQFYTRLHYLKRQGLVVKGDAKVAPWLLTEKGGKRLKKYERLRTDPFSSTHTHFSPQKIEGITIIAFDIPEKERRKRTWLRTSLIEMDFESLQKSVWMAQGGGVHEDFIHALRERKLLDVVHIFAVTKQGTIKEKR